MANISELTARNAQRWRAAKVIRTGFDSVAMRLVGAKARYLGIQKRTGVPWFIVAVIHEREASQNWDRSIAQGDPWRSESVHVPKGRGPFQSWEEAAFDALQNCAPYAAKWKDWSAGGAMTLLEEYNGLGYANRGVPDPYIWSGTDQYVRGKYVADHIYDPNEIDHQLGCAGLLLAMRKIDPTIVFADEAASPPDVPAPEKPTQPAPQERVSPFWAAISLIFKLIASIIFNKRS